MTFSSKKICHLIHKIDPLPIQGRITQAIGLVLEGHAAISSIGEICQISPTDQSAPLLGEVVGFREKKVLMMPLGELHGIGPGSAINSQGKRACAQVGEALLGRIIDGMGNAIDGKSTPVIEIERPLYTAPPNAMERKRISKPLDLGIRSINGLLTCGLGQRLGIFAGSGVGKSVLMGMVSRFTSADINVIALIGERGREVKEFIEKELKEEGLRRSVLIVATSEQAPLIRRRAAFLAITIAEYFRDCGKNVLFMMDSLTRLAHAQREIGLAIGEPPTTKGYTPSVFALLPKFLERAGNTSGQGSITGLYTVLVEGDDMNDPIPDTARSILDGHFVLSRELAAENHYPAIDILNSTSRVMTDIVNPRHLASARKLTQLLATYKKSEDLINIGAYKPGSNHKIDESIAKIDQIQDYLCQGMNKRTGFQESLDALHQLFIPLPEKQNGEKRLTK
ncbi:MAG: FliI/YscN family ATPase [Nitrospiria bacterium]